MRENVALFQPDGLRSGPGAIQVELHWPERRSGVFLADGNLGIGSSDAGRGDRIPACFRHFGRRAEAPDRPVQRADFEEDDPAWHGSEELVQPGVVPYFPSQDLRITVSPGRTGAG